MPTYEEEWEVKMSLPAKIRYCLLMWYLWAVRLRTGSWDGKKK